MVKSLIDKKHRFIQNRQGSWERFYSKTKVTIEPATEWLQEVSYELQKKGYVGWFGLNKTGTKKIEKKIENHIEKLFKNIIKRKL